MRYRRIRRDVSTREERKEDKKWRTAKRTKEVEEDTKRFEEEEAKAGEEDV